MWMYKINAKKWLVSSIADDSYTIKLSGISLYLEWWFVELLIVSNSSSALASAYNSDAALEVYINSAFDGYDNYKMFLESALFFTNMLII